MDMRDTLTIDGTARETRDGYLVASVLAARTGIQTYSGAEVGKPELASVRVYRPADQVFNKDAMASFTSLPITVDHPNEMVTADTWRKYAVGNTGEDIARDGEFIRVPIIVKDVAAINAIKSGKRELSMGYTTDLKWEPGTAPDGSAYDAVQTSITGNHLAIVTAARGGNQLRIGDSKPMKTIVHDGIAIEFADQAADAYNSLLAKLNSATATIAARDTTIAAKDTELAKKDGEIDGLKAKVLSGAQLDAAVAKRADLIAIAKAIAPNTVTDGKSDMDIRKAVLAERGVALDGKSDAYVEARFDVLADEAKQHGNVNRAIASGAHSAGQYTQKTVHDAAIKSANDQNEWRNAKH